jgi:hypothetical protein
MRFRDERETYLAHIQEINEELIHFENTLDKPDNFSFQDDHVSACRKHLDVIEAVIRVINARFKKYS